METKSIDELRRRLPVGVEPIPLRNVYPAAFQQTDPAFPSAERDALARRVSRMRWRKRHCFRVIENPGGEVACENALHPVISEFLPDGTIQFYAYEEGFGGAKGRVPAVFVHLTLPWPPALDSGMKPEFVCGFCAAALHEAWTEAEGEARCS